MNKVAIIVTGSRYYEHYGRIANRIVRYNKSHDIHHRILIHGNAPGADRIAENAASDWGIISLSANWNKFGKAAGPIRNETMLRVLKTLRDGGYDVFVEAFPIEKSVGTKHMIKIAQAAGIPVIIEPYA